MLLLRLVMQSPHLAPWFLGTLILDAAAHHDTKSCKTVKQSHEVDHVEINKLVSINLSDRRLIGLGSGFSSRSPEIS